MNTETNTATSASTIAEEIKTIISRIERPEKATITAGMPYANGPLHIGHLAGTILPADIFARWVRMLIGSDNTLFVFGSDDHGSNSEVSAKKQNLSTPEFISKIHAGQKSTLERYHVSMDLYGGTSNSEVLPFHRDFCQQQLRTLHKNGMLTKKASMQWFDPDANMFLPDRFIRGECPNPECDNKKAYSDECDSCGGTHEPSELKNPVSEISGKAPVLKETEHWWLDMWKVSDQLVEWIESKKRVWRKPLYNESISTVLPCLSFSNKFEPDYKNIKDSLESHKSRYAPGKKVVCQFNSVKDLETSKAKLESNGIEAVLVDSWAHRSITRDISWGIPVPSDIDETMEGKSLYVWPESLYAPIGFTHTALTSKKDATTDTWESYWKNPKAKVFQFLGQDNNFFYVVMQGALWLGTQKETTRLPDSEELQLTDIFSCFHLQVDNQKVSKSKGNGFTGDQLIDEFGYHPDQLRYFFALLSLTEKPSNFDFDALKKRNEFLSGPLNASFEKPLSAAAKHYDSKVPEGNLTDKTIKETKKIIQIYLKSMQKAEYAKLLFAIENYARIINGLFNQYKPHDDRFPCDERKDALYSSFYILKNLVIMLYPFAPQTIDSLRIALKLPESVYRIDELAVPIAFGHKVGEKTTFFPDAGVNETE